MGETESKPGSVNGATEKGHADRVVEQYWTDHNVTSHRRFSSIEDSVNYFHWRNAQYFRYIDLMPVNGADGLSVLDFGCGPGHDLVGFGVFSKPARLIGCDVSANSLSEAAERLSLHSINAEILHQDVHVAPLPLDTQCLDLIHSSGVLHHMRQPHLAFAEFRRILKPGGRLQIMVYNYSSLWMHLYVAYQRQIVEGLHQGLDLRAAFAASTDGPDCPISRAYTPDEFVALAKAEGFRCESFGAAIAVWEMSLLPKRFDALMNERLPSESRKFLSSLAFDEYGLPLHKGVHAGVDGCYHLLKQ